MKAIHPWVALLFAWSAHSALIYDNSTAYQGTHLTSSLEIGDQVEFVGTERILTDFTTEIFSRSAGPNASMRLRFYRNDGPIDSLTWLPAPGTVIYESAPMMLPPIEFFALQLSGMNIPVPANSMTWAVEFSGIGAGGEVGLLRYGPVSVGNSATFFWERNSSGEWHATSTPGEGNNFSARIQAIEGSAPEPVSAEQTITVNGRFNFVGVEVMVGSNTLAGLFPDAPTGMAIFTFENARGYEAFEKFDFGWSQPNARILPGQGFFATLPSLDENTGLPLTYTTTLKGHIPTNAPPVFRGWNLLSSSHVGRQPGFDAFRAHEGDFAYRFDKATVMYTVSSFNAFNQEWEPRLSPVRGECYWYYAGAGWAAHPAGTFAAERTSVYVNNRSAAYDSQARFVSATGVPLTGQAQLYAVTPAGRLPVGAPLPLGTGEHAGYLDHTANLISYLDSGLGGFVDLVLVVTGPEGSGETEPVQILNSFGFGGPLTVPNGLTDLRFVSDPIVAAPVPEFILQPESIIGKYGNPIELRTVFNYPLAQPTPTNSLSFESPCTDPGGCPVRYEWQRKIVEGVWLTLADQTSDTLRLTHLEEIDFASYRLWARWGTNEAFSSEATVFRPLSVRATQISSTGQNIRVQLDTAAGNQSFVVVDVSEDLRTWRAAGCPQSVDPAKVTTVTLDIPSPGGNLFFRLRAGAQAADLVTSGSGMDCN